MGHLPDGGINNRLQVWAGSYDDTSGADDLELKDQYGVNLTSNVGDFTARAMYYTVTVDGTSTQSISENTLINLAGPFPPAASRGFYCGTDTNYSAFPNTTSCTWTQGFSGAAAKDTDFYTITAEAEDDLDYASLGFQWDNGEYFAIVETTDLRAQDGLFFEDQKSGYVSGGMRVADWTPYATYGWAYTYNESDYVNSSGTGSIVCAGKTSATACSSASKSTSLGVRKELGANMAMKIQADHYYDFEDTNGYFGFDASKKSWQNADVLSITLDAVF